MSYRVLIFDDDQNIRKLMWTLFDSRGYEVFTFPHPGSCPLNHVDNCLCSEGESCSDVIISNLEMPNLNGLDFIEKQVKKGCRCSNIALMSGNITDAQTVRAQSLESQIFNKPIDI